MVVGLLAILKAGGAYVPARSGLSRRAPAADARGCRPVLLLCDAAGRAALGEHARAGDAVSHSMHPRLRGRRCPTSNPDDPSACAHTISPTSSTPPAPPASPRASWSSIAGLSTTCSGAVDAYARECRLCRFLFAGLRCNRRPVCTHRSYVAARYAAARARGNRCAASAALATADARQHFTPALLIAGSAS